MVPGHPSHSALGAFHPTPIASSRISTHPTARRRRRKRARMQCGTLRRGRRRGRNPPERSCATVGARVNPHPDGGHPRPRDNHDVALPVARPVRLPRRSNPHHRGCARRQDRDGESAPRAQPEGSPRRPLSRRRRTPARPRATTTGCAGSQISCRKRTAPPPSRCSKDVTAHPHRPGGRPGRPCPAPVRSGRHRPAKGRFSSPYRNLYRVVSPSHPRSKIPVAI